MLIKLKCQFSFLIKNCTQICFFKYKCDYSKCFTNVVVNLRMDI